MIEIWSCLPRPANGRKYRELSFLRRQKKDENFLEKIRVAEVDSENLVIDAAPAYKSFTTEDVYAEPIQNKTLNNNPSCDTKSRRSQCVHKPSDRYGPANYN